MASGDTADMKLNILRLRTRVFLMFVFLTEFIENIDNRKESLTFNFSRMDWAECRHVSFYKVQ